MKRLFVLFLVVVFCMTGTGCHQADAPDSSGNLNETSNAGNGGIHLAEDEFQKNARNTDGTAVTRFVQFSPTGIYFENSRIYYTEAESLATTILCSKPECNHDDASVCNAYLGLDLQYYDGSLYAADWAEDGNITLYKYDLAGNSQETVMKLHDDQQIGSISDIFLIHRGKVLFSGDFGSVKVTNLGEPLEAAETLFEVTQEDAETWQQQSGWSGMAPYSWQFWADGQYLYYMGSPGQLWADRPYSTDHSNELYRYNMETGECVLVWNLPTDDVVGNWTLATVSTSGWYIENDMIYFFLSDNGVWMTNLESGETTQLISTANDSGQRGVAYFDGENIYINNCEYNAITYYGAKREERMIYVYSMDGTFLKSVSMQELFDKEDGSYLNILGSDGKSLIVDFVTNDISGNGADGYYAIDWETEAITRLSN